MIQIMSKNTWNIMNYTKTINMITIIKDYFLYDRANNSLVKFDSGDIVLYGNKEEAIDDKYGNEEVIQFENLPINKQKEIIKQLKNN